MPPYWALGFHLCRYGYETLGTMQAAVNRMRQYNIPQVKKSNNYNLNNYYSMDSSDSMKNTFWIKLTLNTLALASILVLVVALH